MSKPDKLTRFVEAIRSSGLLSSLEMEGVEAAARLPDADGQDLARDLVARRLLTPYQVKALWRGRGKDLFLNQYVLLDKLGEGGMGEVYRARHTRMDRVVALKVMRRERLANPEAVRRFRREIKAMAALAHENVVMAYDADQSGDVHFFAMEYVDGESLDRIVRDRKALPVEEACNYIRQAAQGLQHAHERGLIHRDIKPGNLLVDRSGTVKISDLGLVLVEDMEDSAGRITREGLTVGTPDFVAPEQARNPRGADIRADIYSLGCTFYFLLTGEVPFPGGTPTEKMLRHSRENVPEPKRADVSDELKAVLWKMTVKKPEQRFSTPGEVALALEPFLANRSGVIAIAEVEAAPEEDARPSGETASQELFALPETPHENPRSRRAGCLPSVLGVTLFAVGGLAWWLLSAG